MWWAGRGAVESGGEQNDFGKHHQMGQGNSDLVIGIITLHPCRKSVRFENMSTDHDLSCWFLSILSWAEWMQMLARRTHTF